MRTSRGILKGCGRSSLRTSNASLARASLGLSFLFKIQVVTWACRLAITCAVYLNAIISSLEKDSRGLASSPRSDPARGRDVGVIAPAARRALLHLLRATWEELLSPPDRQFPREN